MVDVPDEIELTAPQARVLGSLIEKAATTPDAYPLTLKALTTACNQTSSRDPVVDYEPQLVETTVLALKAKGLARVVHPGAGERATKYRHVAHEALELGPAELAVLAVLLLRGAQTVSELRTRTERLHGFASADEVESTLERMAAWPGRPLVVRVERQPGQKEARWIQLLEADVEGRAAASATAGTAGGVAGRSGRVEELEQRVARLEQRVAQLVEALGDLVELPADAPSD
ncbi:YceH family protein [Actinomarinicola tropica]|uniref:DUF480 domain-containing protein n=1 Tax=Actinomarinicola tropica TaxID=2789776 RepID=A0A5Q2RJB1_9ACTN|nr:DUF480 domain-containing protein [Actinomarinicola tropica]QGG95893.1 DUF480 domain-containing protein [Actinomarinicola tropica]